VPAGGGNHATRALKPGWWQVVAESKAEGKLSRNARRFATVK
jgi:hypothetical protein